MTTHEMRMVTTFTYDCFCLFLIMDLSIKIKKSVEAIHKYIYLVYICQKENKEMSSLNILIYS